VPRRYRSVSDLPAILPVFPLTGVLLLPQTRLPLNIFEPRYLTMVDAVMAGQRLIGMIQPRNPGEDMARKPELASVGCAGRITEYTESENGRYLITLTGIARFHVSGERETPNPYREVAADYSLFAKDLQPTDDVRIARGRLLAALKPYLTSRAMQTDWKSVEDAPPDTLVNALCVLCPFGPHEKQALLEAPTLKERADALIALLEMANASAMPSGGSPSVN
jgi:Lon protease-like protein